MMTTLSTPCAQPLERSTSPMISKLLTLTRDSQPFREKLPVFATEGFMKSKSEEYAWLVDESFVTPLIVDKRGGFRRVTLMNEPIALAGPDPAREREHLNQVCGFCKKHLRANSVGAHGNAVFRVLPDNCSEIDWGSYLVALDGGEEELLARMQARTRTKLRGAIRAGVQVENTSDIDGIFGVLKDTMVRQNELFYPSRDYLARLKQNLGENAAYFVCRLDGQIQGGVVMLFNRWRGFYYYGGSAEKPLDGSIALMHFEIMKFLQARSVPIYDLMGARTVFEPGSKFIGIQQFKSRLGGVLQVGKTFRVVLRPMQYHLFRMMLGVYFKLKGGEFKGDAIDQVHRASKLPDRVMAPGL